MEALPGVLESQGEGPFIFRELGSTSKYLKGSGEQKKDLGGFREQKKKTFRELRKNKPGSWGEGSIFSGSREQRPPPPPAKASLFAYHIFYKKANIQTTILPIIMQ